MGKKQVPVLLPMYEFGSYFGALCHTWKKLDLQGSLCLEEGREESSA